MINTGRYENRSFFKGEKLRFPLPLLHGFPLFNQRMYSERERDNADDQETPGDKLVPGKRVSKPVIHIQKKKGKDELESKEPEKAVGTPIAE